ncbi:TetR family transcriptional regulator [Pseudonocardia sp. KRD-184]|uniref:TetR family transcriptional regulator n=1 Tax=Pseudonocardia oceani TaxID=2792013 RepID=A0ABS6U2G0_9PSEU|nr:TetR family transcriptional regulator [Pseudonocardia oceani]MBW0088121.1 TetR family transcriptional regulator [Pseudonocardia oceani]MBW0096295.1 TetR family transcriptional regulator [Pseudonocardia oceani]MBW0107151.1 TetR family transcriptional regulator [Pseudonocardia oceani]MBW0113534.1 TetR family transcriptional regulator [Pseudonocardia oceani]MBW0119753.1 TetR family transcriptional regulator [Pseudonocardia oceani]
MAQRQHRFPGVTRHLLREAAIDATAEVADRSGWESLRMGDVAAAVGISRQTLYAEFGSKPALIRAVVLRRTDRLLGALSAVLADAGGDEQEAVRTCCRFVLNAAREDPMVTCLLTGAESGLLDLVTTDSAPIIDRATAALTGHVLRRRPSADPRRVAVAADALARLLVSHVVLPDRDVDTVADEIAELVGPYLREVLSTG